MISDLTKAFKMLHFLEQAMHETGKESKFLWTKTRVPYLGCNTFFSFAQSAACA